MSEPWQERQRRWKQFVSTPIGEAFAKFENLHARAWQKDTELGFGHCSEKSAIEAMAHANKARRQLLKLLGFENVEAD